MCASIALSAVVIGTNASIHLDTSWSASPGPAGFCIIHHIIILILTYKERKSRRNGRTAVPAVAKLVSVMCIWLALAMWVLILGFDASAFHAEKTSHYIPDKDTPKYPIILSFIVVELVVVVAITIIMTVERSALLRRKESSVIVELS